MCLVSMLCVDRDAVICDLAETYHILDYRALPVRLLATLCCGLRDDSRIKLKMHGLVHVPEAFTAVSMADNLTLIRHFLTNDKKIDKKSLFSEIIQIKEKHPENNFATSEEFLKWREAFVGGEVNG